MHGLLLTVNAERANHKGFELFDPPGLVEGLAIHAQGLERDVDQPETPCSTSRRSISARSRSLHATAL